MIRDRLESTTARSPWRGYWRRMLWLGALSAVLAVAALLWMRWSGTQMPWQGRLAVAAGVFFTTLVTAALMGLVFTSARSGHDLAIQSLDQPE